MAGDDARPWGERSQDSAASEEGAPDHGHEPRSNGDANVPDVVVTASMVNGSDSTDPVRAAGPRRRSHRRATGGTAPDAERSLRTDEWGAGPEALGSDAPDPREAAAENDHTQWLKQQRPPHWG